VDEGDDVAQAFRLESLPCKQKAFISTRQRMKAFDEFRQKSFDGLASSFS
jgi:hypothetical protein